MAKSITSSCDGARAHIYKWRQRFLDCVNFYLTYNLYGKGDEINFGDDLYLVTKITLRYTFIWRVSYDDEKQVPNYIMMAKSITNYTRIKKRHKKRTVVVLELISTNGGKAFLDNVIFYLTYNLYGKAFVMMLGLIFTIGGKAFLNSVIFYPTYNQYGKGDKINFGEGIYLLYTTKVIHVGIIGIAFAAAVMVFGLIFTNGGKAFLDSVIFYPTYNLYGKGDEINFGEGIYLVIEIHIRKEGFKR
ncbi:hypothetical protein COLO4_18968 [Corchorus olitorius]|uniref:Uncharacterized protein n=1 Tax=Corchorus olitorius TaxID=93759 RepID=A0A1R3J794_9ROSI|nr:hypothetical protein COLO4_18968 [Corchorus olitorius]